MKLTNLAVLIKTVHSDSTVKMSVELKNIVVNALDDIQALINQNKELSETNKKIRQVLIKQSQDIISGKIDGEKAQVIVEGLTE